MSDVKIWGYAGSTFVRTARMACEEKGVSHSLEPPDDRDSAGYRALHPFGKMPVLQRDGLTLFETLAICEYVDEAFDGPSLKPSSPDARALMYQWVSAINDYFYRDVIHRYVLALKYGEPSSEEIEVARDEVRHRLEVANRALEGRAWLAGEELSLADLFLAPILAYVAGLPDAGELAAGLGDLQRFENAVGQRRSFAATVP